MLPTFFFLHNKLYFYPSSSTIRTQPQAPVRPLHPPQSLPLPLVLNPLHLPFAKAQPRATKPGRTTLCGRLEQALRSDAYVGFREGQLTLVNHSRSYRLAQSCSAHVVRPGFVARGVPFATLSPLSPPKLFQNLPNSPPVTNHILLPFPWKKPRIIRQTKPLIQK